ncbi:MAG: hypothetical protein A3G75_10080, partial [Verrucomicrobia bacterium RIFCSPLOWO2_12_FULL_64_8]
MLERWLRRRERADALLAGAGGVSDAGDETPGGPSGTGPDRARCQHLLFGAIRHRGRLDAAIEKVVARAPRPRLRAVLLIAGYELLEAGMTPDGEAQAARIVHHAVGQAKVLLSAAEAGLVNAVLRRLPAAAGFGAPAPAAGATPADLARFFSHPVWLVRRWLAQFGAEPALSLLRWNQTPPPVYARWRSADAPPAWLHATTWPEFFVVSAGRWTEVERLLAAGALYLQDPATRLPVELLDPRPGETVLDLCAAPGGKSLLLADLLHARSTARHLAVSGKPPDPPSAVAPGGTRESRVVAVDLPDERRIGRLKENLARARGTDVALVQADVLRLGPVLFQQHGLPAAYPAVLLDVPCSNTGVMRHRVD